MAAPTNTSRRLIKRKAVEAMTGISCTEIYRRIAAGSFPKQVRLGPRSVAWVESEIVAWCDEIAALRSNSPSPANLQRNDELTKRSPAYDEREASHA